jgi:peptidyl-prolyl cis-trans isomerase D
MLQSLRSAAGTWVAKLLLILLVLSFAVWGISGQIMGGADANTVVSVGDTSVSVEEYRLAYDRQLAVLSQQFGQRITREQAQALGVDNQVLAQLVAGAVLDEQARLMGLGVSRDRLAELTAEDPAFRGPDGRFNRLQFDFVLRQVGMRPEDYLRNREQVAVRQQIVEAVSSGMDVPETFLRALALYRGEDRTVEYLVLPRRLVEPVAEPGTDELEAYFEENKSRYAAPEYRRIAYVRLNAEALADPQAVSEEAVRQEYERTIGRYTQPERRTIEQIVFPSEEAAREAARRLAEGATFEEVAEAAGRSMEDIRLGTFAKADIPDPTIAEAAFSLEPGRPSGVIAGQFGPVILRVTDVEPAVIRPFEEVADEIRQQIALAEAGQAVLDAYDTYEDARAAGDSLEEAARKLSLPVEVVEAVDRSGQTPDGEILDDLPASSDLLREAFETEPEAENPPINLSGGGFLFYEVREIIPARDRTLDEVRDRVLADWKDEQAEQKLAALADSIRERVAGGENLAEIAAEYGLEVQTKRGLRRGADDPDLGSGGVSAVFSLSRGEVGSVVAPTDDGRIVFKVTEIFEPAGAGPESVDPQTRDAFAEAMAGDLLDQLVAQLQDRFEVRVNQSAVTRALSF